MDDLNGHYTRLVSALTRCQIIPFLGPNINLCGRPQKKKGKLEDWLHGNFAPSNQELALLLNQQSNSLYSHEVCCPLLNTEELERLLVGCPIKQGAITRMPLQHVAQYIVDMRDDGEDILYGELTKIINATYHPNPLHNFLARLLVIMRKKGYYPPYPLFVTTCFDTTLEQAFDNADVSYDLISFVGQRDGGNFEHKSPGGMSMPIEDPNTHIDFLIERPVILKLYGGYGERVVVAEDDFIDYLAPQNMVQLLPISILDALQNTAYIWFLGYSPSYWNQRVILYRIWKDHIFGKPGQR
jgi:hypothetical protein